MPTTYATAFAAHHARGSTLRPRDTTFRPRDTMVHRPTMLRPRDTMIHRPTMLRPRDTMVRHQPTTTTTRSTPTPIAAGGHGRADLVGDYSAITTPSAVSAWKSPMNS